MLWERLRQPLRHPGKRELHQFELEVWEAAHNRKAVAIPDPLRRVNTGRSQTLQGGTTPDGLDLISTRNSELEAHRNRVRIAAETW